MPEPQRTADHGQKTGPRPQHLGFLTVTLNTSGGHAQLNLTLDRGQVASYKLDTACSHHIALVAKLVEGRELGDALVAVGSLDLSPWEVIP